MSLAFRIMGREHPRQVTLHDLAAFKRLQQDKAPATVALRFAAVQSYFAYLIETGELRRNPAASLKPPRLHSPAPRELTLKQAKRIAAKINTDTVTGKRDAAAIALLFGSLRLGGGG